MGIFGKIKELVQIHKEVKNLIKTIEEEKDFYLAMTNDEVFALDSNEKLHSALSYRIGETDDIEESLNAFSGAKKVFFVLNLFDAEIQNGGLCQFFVNSSRVTAPLVAQYLKEVGADKIYELYDNFLRDNNISPYELDSFIIDDVDNFEEQNNRYPFDDFDEAYYEIYETESIEELTAEYARKHYSDFE
ncbi:MAG: DMP19 family protein [Faecalibacterium sp.]|nr:DMP19 family protein [Ruminococcus sp.]MCM1391501.1 DMP19 family protein [Ruminococcus sp.]MCM1485865.1 DMP19 family protein [Faecalibacterium sp.]